jgi:hypothetical protein
MKTAEALLLALFLCVGSIAAAAENSQPPSLFHKAIFGLALHDRGPFSDRNERGVDPNLELQFSSPGWRAWQWIGSPFLKVGATPNFNGGTSALYAGIAYEFSLSNKYTDAFTYNFTKGLFVAGGLSAALHNGPLHKNKIGCEERSDCGFGYRVLPRLDIELGRYFGKNHGLSFFYDHMSHKGVLPGENEGVDHIGMRYHYTFPGPTS